MSVDQNIQKNGQENIDNLKAKNSAEFPKYSSDMEPKSKDVEKQEPQRNGATTNEDFPDLKRKKLSIEETTWDIENGLRWIRKELTDMRQQDRVLTKQLIGMRSKVNEISRLVESDENLIEDENKDY